MKLGTTDETIRHRLGKLDNQNYSSIPRRVDFGELPSKVIGSRHVAPLIAPGVGNPNATSISPYGRKNLYLGPVRVADRHR